MEVGAGRDFFPKKKKQKNFSPNLEAVSLRAAARGAEKKKKKKEQTLPESI